MHSLDAEKVSLDLLKVADPTEKAAAMLAGSRAIGVPDFIKPSDVVSGSKRLNLAFCAQIFNTKHGLVLLEEEKKKVEEVVEEELDDDAREERVFRMWMNSLSLGGDASWTCQHLFNDLNGGAGLAGGRRRPVPLIPLHLPRVCAQTASRCSRPSRRSCRGRSS